ncbi:glycosyltransferase [uncultured Desulfobacter sp.]|uniref:glycosyltransferase n=1 Tax=uncultured Desulfobacter sp. TaxID=240139 RepID=UPI0029F45FE7|nr:glycosyltransferase [uncultured Desulfobacter sp.]
MPEKPNVLFLLPSLKRAGAETQMVDLINNINRKEFNIHVVTFLNDFSLLKRLNTKDINYQYIPRRSKFAVGYLFSLKTFIKKHNIRLIHCTIQFSLLVAWLSLAITLFKKKIKLICAIHTTINVRLKGDLIDRFIYSKLLRQCEEIIFVCRAQRDYWVAKYPELKKASKVVYNGVDIRRYDPEICEVQGTRLIESLNISPECRIIACIAGFRPEKRHDKLLRVFARLPNDYRLLLAGDGPLKQEMEDYATQLGVMERTYFLGNMSDVRPVLAVADITVLASTAVETFSIAMLESLSMNTPVIAPDIGGLKEAIGLSPCNGAVYSIGNEDAFYKAIIQFDDSCEEKRCESPRGCVKRYFDNRHMARQTVRIISKSMHRG